MLKKSKPFTSQPLNIVTKINDWQNHREQFAQQKVGFVPTMGNLHAGHLALCERAQKENDITVVSIYVNQTQFNHADDYAAYPRTIENDIALLSEQGIDYLFLPDDEAIYPDQYTLRLEENKISTDLEGEHRPGHFTGMLTVVLKLLNIIQPTYAYFGEKDYQQLLLVEKMVAALFVPVTIIGCPIVRDSNGLALSSRNSRLTEAERMHAAHLYRLLTSDLAITEIITELNRLNFKVDYIVEKWQRRLAAVWLGDVRLIDNISL